MYVFYTLEISSSTNGEGGEGGGLGAEGGIFNKTKCLACSLHYENNPLFSTHFCYSRL